VIPVPGPWLGYIARVVLAVALAPVLVALSGVALVTLTLVTLAWSCTKAGREFVGTLWGQVFEFVESVVHELVGTGTDSTDGHDSSLRVPAHRDGRPTGAKTR
jgi:hypothetical protein